MLRRITPTMKKNPYLKEFRRRMRFNPTGAEKHLAKLLHQVKVKFSKQQVFVDGPIKYIADFWLWEYSVIMECDGGYHEDTIEEDAERDRLFALAGIRTIRITNEDVFKMDKAQMRELIRSL